MFVYCDAECEHNEDGMCNNRWPIGANAIRIEENWMGIPHCTDFKQKEEDEDERYDFQTGSDR